MEFFQQLVCIDFHQQGLIVSLLDLETEVRDL